MSSQYEISIIRQKMGWYAARDSSDQYILVEAMGHHFELHDKLIVNDGIVWNITRKEETSSIIHNYTDRTNAEKILKSLI
ncbi:MULTISPECIES: hypothetical protein [unclassified Acinetobacter]|uniref:hypothetical protein n=1 Tax=unclassified Acinetobacter TaxID=196816 RepID=UPI00293474D9|nr:MULTISPECIES: hypothetical protein [unclassified Acinetobacter]WOE32094.1 hypothetical protein QSG84_02450 [Acinetobacter sp. SAAs470]WOE37563.1 hypothetical protein QSG86_11495 [Acinetobacter sp. SAAs474]